MQTTHAGSIIYGVLAVEQSVCLPNAIAFKDSHGAIIHITLDALDELIKYRNKLIPLETTNFIQ